MSLREVCEVSRQDRGLEAGVGRPLGEVLSVDTDEWYRLARTPVLRDVTQRVPRGAKRRPVADPEAKEVDHVGQGPVRGFDEIGEHRASAGRQHPSPSVKPSPQLLRWHVLHDAVHKDQIESRTIPRTRPWLRRHPGQIAESRVGEPSGSSLGDRPHRDRRVPPPQLAHERGESSGDEAVTAPEVQYPLVEAHSHLRHEGFHVESSLIVVNGRIPEMIEIRQPVPAHAPLRSRDRSIASCQAGNGRWAAVDAGRKPSERRAEAFARIIRSIA